MTEGAAADAGDTDDFEVLVAQHRARVFRLALASLRDRDAAESVTQDCFCKAHRAWSEFRSDCSVQTWLMQIAVNLIRDVARSRRFQFWRRAQSSSELLEGAGLIADARLTPEENAAANQQVASIWRVAETLSANQRTVFLLHFMEDMNAAEIEAATGISKAAIKVHLFRAVKAVRQKLGKVR